MMLLTLALASASFGCLVYALYPREVAAPPCDDPPSRTLH